MAGVGVESAQSVAWAARARAARASARSGGGAHDDELHDAVVDPPLWVLVRVHQERQHAPARLDFIARRRLAEAVKAEELAGLELEEAVVLEHLVDLLARRRGALRRVAAAAAAHERLDEREHRFLAGAERAIAAVHHDLDRELPRIEHFVIERVLVGERLLLGAHVLALLAQRAHRAGQQTVHLLIEGVPLLRAVLHPFECARVLEHLRIVLLVCRETQVKGAGWWRAQRQRARAISIECGRGELDRALR